MSTIELKKAREKGFLLLSLSRPKEEENVSLIITIPTISITQKTDKSKGETTFFVKFGVIFLFSDTKSAEYSSYNFFCNYLAANGA